MPAGAVASSPEWQECVHNAFDFMWCVRALKLVSVLPAWVHHYDLELYDLLYDLSARVCGNGGVLLPGYRRTRMQQVVLRHGMHFALEHQRMQLRAGAPGGESGLGTLTTSDAPASLAPPHGASGESCIRRISHQLGSNSVLRLCTSASDVQQLLSRLNSKDLADSSALANNAIHQGYLMLPASAAAFVRLANSDARAWDVLLRQRYLALRGSLAASGKSGKQPKAGLCDVASSVPPQIDEGPGATQMSSLVGVGFVTVQPAVLESPVAELTANEKAARAREQDRLRKQQARDSLKSNDPAAYERQRKHASALRKARRQAASAGATGALGAEAVDSETVGS